MDARRLVAGALTRSQGPWPRYVVAAGKAAWPMYAAAADVAPIVRGVLATPLAAAQQIPEEIAAFDAGHPAPNQASAAAGDAALRLARQSVSEGGLLVLLSGGASAMLAAPVHGLSIQDKVETARVLMLAGAPIDELNCVRKHLSRIKGGSLAAMAGRTVTLALSDVHGPIADDPSVIGSAPTVPDSTTFADALNVIRRRKATVPAGVSGYLERGARGEVPETVKPADPRLVESSYVIVGNRHTAAEGARLAAGTLGYRVVTLSSATTGEARQAAMDFVAGARAAADDSSRPMCVIATGETTVTVVGNGLGGRNQEFALASAGLLDPFGAAVLGSAGTDGIDGPTDAAGAIVDTESIARARALGLEAGAALASNDAYHFFERLGDLILWGPTGTNVGDLHVLLAG